MPTIGEGAMGVYMGSRVGIPEQYSSTSATLNAAGESIAYIGKLYLEGGSGSKTISTSGGKIHWAPPIASTFASASTTLKIGIQDVAATGLEDGTYDVYGELVAGTDTITIPGLQTMAMESGTKTITHGDTVAIVFEMTVRAGADSLAIPYCTVGDRPYVTIDTGAGPVIGQGAGFVTVEFDDGTLGWLEFGWYATNSAVSGTAVAVGSSSTPDEYALIFQLPFRAQITAVLASIGSLAATDDFELILYSDPLGTPTVVETITIDATYTALFSSSTPLIARFANVNLLNANTNYALAIRPTTTNTINVYYYDYGSGNEKLMKPTTLGRNWYLGTRSDQTGAFTATTYRLPLLGFYLNDISGFKTHPGMHGGMRG